MENMIKRIVQMDEQARLLTQDAQRAKVDSAAGIAQKKKEMREDYISRARSRIKENEKAEQAAAEAEWKEIEQKYQRMTQQMDETYHARREQWVEHIVSHVIRG